MKQFIVVLLVFITVGAAGCAKRLPSERKTTHLIREYFNNYAKEYNQSSFGNKKVKNVEVLSIKELHKNFITAQAFVTMAGENVDVYKVRVTIEKGPFGWRYVSWENLSGN